MLASQDYGHVFKSHLNGHDGYSFNATKFIFKFFLLNLIEEENSKSKTSMEEMMYELVFMIILMSFGI